MLRPIPEDQSEQDAALAAAEYYGRNRLLALSSASSADETVSVAEAVVSDDEDDDYENMVIRSNISVASAVLADPEGGGGGDAAGSGSISSDGAGVAGESRDGIFKKKKQQQHQRSKSSSKGGSKSKRGQRHRRKKQHQDGVHLKAHDGKPGQRRKRPAAVNRWASWRSFVVMGIIVVAAVAIVVAIVTTNTSQPSELENIQDGKNDSNNNNNNRTGDPDKDTPPPTASPTHVPTIEPETIASMDSLIDGILVDLSDMVVDEDVHSTLIDARSLARTWMLERDLLRDEVLAEPTPVRFTQRFVLALLFYSMQIHYNNNGETWETTGGSSVLQYEESECDWEGVYCDETIVEQTTTTTIMVRVVRRIQWGKLDAVGVLPPELRSLKYLQELNVSFNALRGTFPSQWVERRSTTNSEPATQIEKDGGIDSSVSSEVVEEIHYLPYLYMLDCSHNQLQGSIPFSLWSLPSLRFVYFTNNSFTGNFPPNEFFLLDNDNDEEEDPRMATMELPSYLQDIWIDRNDLTGTLPSWLFSLDILKSLILEYNDLQGNFSSVSSLPPTLSALDLSYNQFTGIIPPAFFEGLSLTYLYLDHNQFTQLPPGEEDGNKNHTNSTNNDDNATRAVSYTAEVSLAVVWLQHNDLQGTIPSNMGAGWPLLREFKLNHNEELSGTVLPGCPPPGAQQPFPENNTILWPFLSILQADCLPSNATTETAPSQAPVQCECCTSCF